MSLTQCVVRLTRLFDETSDETALIAQSRLALGDLIARDDWLPDFCAKPQQSSYCQYLLHCDPLSRFSLVSFVWSPGQATPIHNHTVWGLVGVLRGAEISERFEIGAPMRLIACDRLDAGAIDLVSPTAGDVHRVQNAFDDRTSISIHLYGANIGAVRRSVFDPATGAAKPFTSGYSSDVVPNLWSAA